MPSEYELVRAQNIARNDEFLAEIGLAGKSTGLESNKRVRTSEKSSKRTRGWERPAEDTAFLRRSSRVAALPVSFTQLDYNAPDDEDLDEDVKRGIRYPTKGYKKYQELSVDQEGNQSGDDINISLVRGPAAVLKGDSASAKELSAVYQRFIGTVAITSNSILKSEDIADTDAKNLMDSNNNLGNLIPDMPFGKAAIMAASNPHNQLHTIDNNNNKNNNSITIGNLGSTGLCPKFSKYSGLVEWKNCIYLWVNLGSHKPGEFINEFSEGGQFMTWYGGSKMHKDSPATQRLLAIHANGKSNKTKDAILLFVRLEGEPYCCLGQVAMHASDVNVHPIAITWKLLQYSDLKDRLNFQRILKMSK